MIFSKKSFFIFLYIIALMLSSQLRSQTSGNNVGDLINQAKAQGLTTEQIRSLAISEGISASEIDQFLESSKTKDSSSEAVTDNLEVENEAPAKNLPSISPKKDPLFGYDFFNNPNISFQPNLNLATPKNYQLGPGDELVISLWGAAENSYNVAVNRNGAVVIPNVGPVLVSGMEIQKAQAKIKSRLSRVFGGIKAANNSPYKIYTDISLASVRTVQVNIIGQVQVPGTYTLSALSTVLNALYASGGPTKQGTFREIKLIRQGEEVSTFDVYRYILEGSQAGNEIIKDQDIIIVGPYMSKVKISGKVKRTGIYEMKNDENFAALFRYVGGFTSDAYKKVIKLERIEDDRKVLKEISAVEFENEKLKDGDLIDVAGIINEIQNRVTIKGAVYRPGDFEYKTGLTFRELLQKASGLTKTAYMDRMIITSTDDGDTQTSASYSLKDVLDGTEQVNLKVDDVVQIFDTANLKEKGTISISGAVNNPKTISFVENIKLEEIVLMAGGYSKEADVSVIDVTREVIDGNYETLAKTFNIQANGLLDIKSNTSFEFKPNDKIVVRSLQGSSERINVTISGEVRYPGSYEVTTKNERILDLVAKSGGLSPYAFEQGGSLVRKNPYYKEVIQQLTSDKINDSTSTRNINIDLNNLEEYRIAIDFKKLLEEGETSKQNMVLKNGDRLIIPSIKQIIKVEGEVLLPSLVRYDKKLSFKEYINKSGGFNTKAKRGKTYVIYPNGDVATTKKFLFFRSYPSIEPGSLVIVPARPERQGSINTQEVLGLTTGFATVALLIERLFSN